MIVLLEPIEMVELTGVSLFPKHCRHILNRTTLGTKIIAFFYH